MNQPSTREEEEEEEEECGFFSSFFLFFPTYLPRLEKGAKKPFLVFGPSFFWRKLKVRHSLHKGQAIVGVGPQ
jgi:hypothetical protein